MGCYGLVEYSICMSVGSAIIERFGLFDRFPVKYFYSASYAIGKFIFFINQNLNSFHFKDRIYNRIALFSRLKLTKTPLTNSIDIYMVR